MYIQQTDKLHVFTKANAIYVLNLVSNQQKVVTVCCG